MKVLPADTTMSLTMVMIPIGQTRVLDWVLVL
jgi:hypothetical protein